MLLHWRSPLLRVYRLLPPRKMYPDAGRFHRLSPLPPKMYPDALPLQTRLPLCVVRLAFALLLPALPQPLLKPWRMKWSWTLSNWSWWLYLLGRHCNIPRFLYHSSVIFSSALHVLCFFESWTIYFFYLGLFIFLILLHIFYLGLFIFLILLHIFSPNLVPCFFF